MFNYILICSLLAHNIWAKPVHSHVEMAPHVLILTPQAQLRLESLVPGAPIIQHLTPFTSYFTPHEETVVYVPASAAAALQNADIFARSIQARKAQIFGPESFQNAIGQALSTGITSAQNAIQQTSTFLTNPSSFSPTDAGSNVISSIIGSASSFIPSQSGAETPTQDQSQQKSKEQAQNIVLSQQLQEQKQLQLEHQRQTQQLHQQQLLEQQQKHKPSLTSDLTITPIITTDETKIPTISLATKIPTVPQLISPIIPSISLYANEPRHHYVVAPVPPHIVDIVPNSVLLSPTVTNTIKARRSITNENKDANSLLTAIILPAIAQPEALPLNDVLEKDKQLNKDKQEEEFKRFLEADSLKEESTLDNSDDILDKGLKETTFSSQKSDKKPTKTAKNPVEINANESRPIKNVTLEDKSENDSPQTKDIKIENQ